MIGFAVPALGVPVRHPPATRPPEDRVPVRRSALAMAVLLTLAGCGGTDVPAASSSPTLTVPRPSASPTARPRPARPGTVCGYDTAIGGIRVKVVVVRGRVTCVTAMRVIRAYDDPDTQAEGSAALVVIGHWTCSTTSRTQTRRTGRVATCTAKTATVQTRTH